MICGKAACMSALRCSRNLCGAAFVLRVRSMHYSQHSRAGATMQTVSKQVRTSTLIAFGVVGPMNRWSFHKSRGPIPGSPVDVRDIQNLAPHFLISRHEGGPIRADASSSEVPSQGLPSRSRL